VCWPKSCSITSMRTGAPMAEGTPLETLEAIAAERTRLAAVERECVEQLRAVGVPWAVIGRALGVTGQAAARRLGQ
jgi:hypothetical protein